MGLNNLSLIGANPTTGSSTAWGMVPQVPDPLSTAATAVGGNLANLGGLTDLASRVNAFNTQQAVNPYIANLPGYQSMVNQSSQNIGANLRGQLAPDEVDYLTRLGAERGAGGGLSGSDNTNTAIMQALGLRSQGLRSQGEQELTQAIGRTPTAPLFNVAQFLTTPGEEQAAQLAANIYRSAPDPQKQAQALIDLFTRFMGRLGQGQNAAPFVIPSGSGPSPYSGGNNAAGGGTPMPPGGGVINAPRPFPIGTGNRNIGPAPSVGGLPPSTVQTSPFTGGPSSFLNQTFAPPNFQNYPTLGMGLDPSLNALFGGYGNEGGFGQPITSPTMNLGGGYQGPDFNAPFGAPISVPGLGNNYGNTEWWNDPNNLFPFEQPSFTPSDRSQFGNPITAPDMFGGYNPPPSFDFPDWAYFPGEEGP